jgi:hypothetical protein
MYINHTKIKGKEYIHVTMINILALLLFLFLHVSQSENDEILHTLNLGCSFITLKEPCDLEVILDGFKLQTIYTMAFPVQWLNNLTTGQEKSDLLIQVMGRFGCTCRLL